MNNSTRETPRTLQDQLSAWRRIEEDEIYIPRNDESEDWKDVDTALEIDRINGLDS